MQMELELNQITIHMRSHVVNSFTLRGRENMYTARETTLNKQLKREVHVRTGKWLYVNILKE